ncbi:hypothetical protein [Nostoc sp. PA-18-2419]|nr:hypothetical protein [Nostoc sp. PA-18-2419]
MAADCYMFALAAWACRAELKSDRSYCGQISSKRDHNINSQQLQTG